MCTQAVWALRPSGQGRQENIIALNLMRSWLQSYYLSFNLVRPVTPFQTIKNFIPKQRDLCPSESLRDSGVGVKAGRRPCKGDENTGSECHEHLKS